MRGGGPKEQLRPRASPCPQPSPLLVGHVTPAVVVHMLSLQCLQPLTADRPVVTLQTRDVVCDKEIHWRGQPSAAAHSFCPPLLASDHGGDICGENAGGGCHSAHLAIVVTSAPGGGMYHPGLCLSRAGEVRSLGGGLQQQADSLPLHTPISSPLTPNTESAPAQRSLDALLTPSCPHLARLPSLLQKVFSGASHHPLWGTP